MNQIEQRIRSTADRMLIESGKIPIVSVVRKEAKSSMAEAVDVMRAWRAEQRMKVQITGQPVPEDVLAASADAAANIWSVATQIANASLVAAEAAFEADKSVNIALASEQAVAFDALFKAYNEQAGHATNLERRVDELEDRNADSLKFSEHEKGEANFRIRELEGQVASLDAGCSELKRELADARQASGSAVERAAHLQGKLEAFQSR